MRWVVRGFVALVVLSGVLGFAAWRLYQRTEEPFRGYDAAEQFVDIAQGQGSLAIGHRLIDAFIVRDEMTWRAAVWRSGRARELKAGEYRFDRSMTALEVIDVIARGEVYTRRLTFREGLTIREMAHAFEDQGFGSVADFLSAASDPSLVRDLDPLATDLEGYLFPETYAFPRHTSAHDVVRQMVSTFKQSFAEAWRIASSSAGLSIRQVVTLASLVEKETAQSDERPLVAAVYRNRFQRGMPMQADPTVIYALELAGLYTGNLRRDDLQFNSPYNTYRYAGLPPGPIASPGLASLMAVVHPADVAYLYFVSRNDGTHAFASTLAEHNRNVLQWQVQYFKNKRSEASNVPRQR